MEKVQGPRTAWETPASDQGKSTMVDKQLYFIALMTNKMVGI